MYTRLIREKEDDAELKEVDVGTVYKPTTTLFKCLIKGLKELYHDTAANKNEGEFYVTVKDKNGTLVYLKISSHVLVKMEEEDNDKNINRQQRDNEVAN